MTNHVRRFKIDNLYSVNKYFHIHGNDSITLKDVEKILSTSNVFFVLSDISRLQSTLICELGFSYVQKSQRYVPLDATGFNFINHTNDELAADATKLITKSIKLYKSMTELKDPNKKGRLTKDDFVNGITYEDARCILPLCNNTNVVTSMSGDGLIKLFALFLEYPIVFRDLQEEFTTLIPADTYKYIFRAASAYMSSEKASINNFYNTELQDIDIENNVVCISYGNGIEQIAIGALASQNNESPEIVYENWGDEKTTNANKIIKNVLGYGHAGISEQARVRFAMQCSLSTYHQVIRHRLQSIERESFVDIINDNDRQYILPINIENNPKFKKKVLALIKDYKKLYETYKHKVDYQYCMQFMLNCAPVKFVNAFNIRHINWVFRERLCFTAQDEIRNLYTKIFDKLYQHYPSIVKYGLPPCVETNKCKEGKMCCGHINEVRVKYTKYI